MRRIRVVRVVHHLVRGGGVQTRLTELLPRLAGEVDVRVLCYKKRGELADVLERSGIPVDCIPRGAKWSPANLRTYARYFRRHRPHVVHTHSYTANTMAIAAARLAGVPVRIRHIHTLIPWGREGRVRTALRMRVDRWAAGLADVTLAVSGAARERFLAGLGLPPDSCRVLYNGIDLARFRGAGAGGASVRRELGIPPEAPVAGVVGRLARGKGHRDFLRAARVVARSEPGAWFLIVGEGPMRADLEAAARELGVRERVVFTGYRSDIPAGLGSGDVFGFPGWPDEGGRIPDGLPGVVIEAQAAGLPVVSFDLPMIPEMLPPAEGVGRIVPAGDAEALARGIVEFLRHRVGEGGVSDRARRNAERFSVETCARRTLELYEELLEKRGCSP